MLRWIMKSINLNHLYDIFHRCCHRCASSHAKWHKMCFIVHIGVVYQDEVNDLVYTYIVWQQHHHCWCVLPHAVAHGHIVINM